jgi:hypothetical protein
MFLAVYAALPRLRAQAGERARPPAPLLAAMLLASTVCLWGLAQNETRAWLLLGLCAAVGGLLFAAARRGRGGVVRWWMR